MSVDIAHHKIFRAKVGKDGIKCNRELRQIEKYILPCNYQLSKSIVHEICHVNDKVTGI